ncbi:hypothetical protein [uncultured Halopseudomonas sp.]|uniref:hypothetical protein n=1 Tax=uncultured Halopseudomonas sp. TaxID=2901193 RepID=UPI0030EE010D
MFIARWLERKQPRFYARLDEMNRCETLWAACNPPDTGRWVEVVELNPFWIGKTLPASARYHARTPVTATGIYI